MGRVSDNVLLGLMPDETDLLSVPEQIGFTSAILNPALPPAKAHTLISPFTPPPGPVTTITRGVGPRRTYLENQKQSIGAAYPPRPISGSIADLDIILEQCNFSEGKVCHSRRSYSYVHVVL